MICTQVHSMRLADAKSNFLIKEKLQARLNYIIQNPDINENSTLYKKDNGAK